MYRRVLLGVYLLLTLSSATLRAQPAESWRESYQLAKTHAAKEEWRQAIHLLHKAAEGNPQPQMGKVLEWTEWEGYYPYLELGRAYLEIDDPSSASYYCSRSKSEGVSPAGEVSACLETAAEKLGQYYQFTKATHNFSFEFPLFPWPPPKTSAQSVLPPSYLLTPGRQRLLKDVALRLEKALEQTGYVEFSYYQIPGGFALVTRIEQFQKDGSSKAPPERWALESAPAKIFSLSDYLKALFCAQKGYYRVISFLVTSVPFAQTQQRISQEDAIAWLTRGANVLPATIGERTYSEYHYCTAYIYEFEQQTRNHSAEFKVPGILTGDVHLKESFLLDTLEKLSQTTTP